MFTENNLVVKKMLYFFKNTLKLLVKSTGNLFIFLDKLAYPQFIAHKRNFLIVTTKKFQYQHYFIIFFAEKVIVTGCESCQLMLTCRQLDSIIAILDVNFKAKTPIYDSGLVKNKTVMPFPPDHPRDSLNKRWVQDIS